MFDSVLNLNKMLNMNTLMKRLHLKVSEQYDTTQGKSFYFHTKWPPHPQHGVRITVVFLISSTLNIQE